MPEGDLLYPPAQYGGGWLFLVLAIVIAAVGIVALIHVLTRPRPLASQPQADPAAVIAQLRSEYLAMIDDLERRAQAGDVDPRRAHAELSRLMRAFVNEHSGLEAPVMTLKDLVALGVHPALLDALDRFTYPSVFRREAPLDPALGAQAARLVVELWR